MSSSITQQPWSLNILLYIIICCFLTPSISFSAGMPAIRLEQLIIFIVFIYFICCICLGQGRLGFSRVFYYATLVFFVFIFFSGFIGGIKGYDFQLRNFVELIKPFEYLVVGLMVLTATLEYKGARKEILKVIVYCGAISFVIGLSQFFNPMNINSYYVQFIAPTQYETLVGGYAWPRVIGLTSNPNVYAFLMTLSAFAAMFLALVYKGYKYWLYWGLITFAVIMSQSRTGLIFFIVVHFVFFVPYFLKYSFRLSKGEFFIQYKNLIVFIIAVLFVLLALTYVIMNSMLMLRIEEASNLFESASVVVRLEHWLEYWEIFQANIVLGVGPAKSLEFAAAADNEWLLLSMRYGLVGVFLFVLFLISPLLGKQDQSSDAGYYKWFSISLILGGMVFMLPAGIYYSMQTFPVFLVMILLMLKPDVVTVGARSNER